jgi:hypothetical protein
MGLVSRIRSVLQNIFRKRQFESQLDEEVRAYVDTVADERIAAGMSVAEARRSALAEFGGIEQVKQAVRELRIGTGVELLWQDARYGVRQLRRNRGFTVAAVITLGLGIGATTAIFSAVYSLLLRPLPYRDSNQLMYVSSAWPKTHVQGATLPSPEFVAARSETKSFEQFAGYIFGDDNLTGAGDPVRVTRAGVTANFFNTLGVAPQLGRNFLHDEDRSGGPLVILLSNRLWRDQFNADPEIVGKAVTLNGTQHVVVGVLPQHFSFPDLQVEPDYYVPVALERDTTLSVTSCLGDACYCPAESGSEHGTGSGGDAGVL